jgi:hypothetical protein
MRVSSSNVWQGYEQRGLAALARSMDDEEMIFINMGITSEHRSLGSSI